MELNQTLVLLYLISVVTAVAVGRECIGHDELALADGDGDSNRVGSLVGRVGAEHQCDVSLTSLGKGVFGVLLIAHHQIFGFAMAAEVPLVDGRQSIYILRIGTEQYCERSLPLKGA